MASDTLAEIRAQVYDRAGVPNNDPRCDVATADRFINAALRKASTTFDPFWLETSTTVSTVAGQNYVPLSAISDFSKMSRVVYGTEVLRPVGKHEIAQYLPYANQQPHAWSIEQERLTLGPTPNAVYTLTCIYYRLEAALTDEDGTPYLPTQYTDWLVLEAAIRVATKMRDGDMVDTLRVERKEWLDAIRNDVRQMRPLPRVRVRGD